MEVDRSSLYTVLVIANYSADRQQSMTRFAELLSRLYAPCAQVRMVAPPVLFSRLPLLPSLARKYLAYIDKLLLFPLWLSFNARSFDRVHIADHSNAFYAYFCPRGRCVITCHDLLAVRGAFGDAKAACDASPIGIWLQRLIMAGLRRADAVAFVSQATFHDFQVLIGSSRGQRLAVIPSPLNASFNPDPSAFSLTTAEEGQCPSHPYLLMVGSALPRKNRGLALQLLERLGETSPYAVVLAGAPLTETEKTFRFTHPLGNRLLSIPFPSHGLLNRLYCKAHALLFPSFSEGFGWPLIEAQTCRCPVIASSTTSIPEVAGEGALYADPSDVATFAEHVRTLKNPSARARLIALGLANAQRYDQQVAREAYLRFTFHSC